MNNMSMLMLKEVASLKNPLMLCSDKREEMLPVFFLHMAHLSGRSGFSVNVNALPHL